MKPVFRTSVAALALCMATAGAALAQGTAEPTVDQIYQTAKAGHLDRAESMVDQVIKSHPTSAKAHYVKAEIAAREGNMSMARQEINTAESLAPGLPFVKPEAARSLREAIAQGENTTAVTHARARDKTVDTRSMGSGAASSGFGGFSWMGIALAAVIVFLLARMMRRRSPSAPAGYGPGGPGVQPPGYGPGYGPQGPQGYGQPGYGPQQGYGPAPGGGMGSSIARGVGTGLAVGAGVLAAEEIGRRVFHHDNNGNVTNVGNDPLPGANADLGGNDFGIADGGSWDDAGGGGIAGGDDFGTGGGDWDNS